MNSNLAQVSNQKLMEQVQNGRVIDIEGKNMPAFAMFEDQTKKNGMNKFKSGALNGIQETSQLSLLYFSKTNIKRVQDKLRHTVYKMSNEKYIIGNQSLIDLEIIMRSVYLQHAQNLDTKYTGMHDYFKCTK